MRETSIFEALGRLQEAYREFHESEPDKQYDLQSFAIWLYHSESTKRGASSERETSAEWKRPLLHGSIDDQISNVFLDMHKLIKFYIKKALEGTELVTVDDLHFLLRLADTESMTKTEIINSHISEMSSGTEVIKRLLKKQLIEDYDDPHDRRSKRVRITKKGMKAVTGIASQLHNLHRLFLGMITEEEKLILLAVVGKLHRFHLNIFNNEKNASLEELFQKYLDTGAGER